MGASPVSVIQRTNTTTTLGSSYLVPTEVGRQFVRRVTDGAPTLKRATQHQMTTRSKQVNYIKSRGRFARGGDSAAENVAPTSQRPFTVASETLTPATVKGGYELTYQLERDNVEGMDFRQKLDEVITEQLSEDLDDLLWNGDDTDYTAASDTISGAHTNSVTTITVSSTTGFPSTTEGYAGLGFLVIDGSERVQYTAKTSTTFTGCTRGADNTTAAAYSGGEAVTFVNDGLLVAFDGVRTLITTAGNVTDGSAVNSGTLASEHFMAALKAVPEKYTNNNKLSGEYAWCANNKMRLEWLEQLSARGTNLGDDALQNKRVASPFGYPWHIDAKLPDGVMVFCPLKYIHMGVRVDNIRRRVTDEGKDLVSREAAYFYYAMEADVALEDSDAFWMVTDITVS